VVGPPSRLTDHGINVWGSSADAVASGQFGTLVSSRGVAPACDLSLVDISAVLGKINSVDVDRYYDTNATILKISGCELWNVRFRGVLGLWPLAFEILGRLITSQAP